MFIKSEIAERTENYFSVVKILYIFKKKIDRKYLLSFSVKINLIETSLINSRAFLKLVCQRFLFSRIT